LTQPPRTCRKLISSTGMKMPGNAICCL
jgi:hypothetical protein